MARANDLGTWYSLATGQDPSHSLHPDRQELVSSMAEHPWNFLSAVDPITKRPFVWTKDENHPDGFRPFPFHKEYLKRTVEVLHNERRVFIEKSRQMIISTTCCLYMLWQCLFKNARRWLISRATEENSVELLRDKIRVPYQFLPEWFRETHRGSKTPAKRMDFKDTHSTIMAVNMSVARRHARGGTSSGFLLDEAAYQDVARDIYSAAGAATEKMFVVSTPSLGLGGQWMHGMILASEGGQLIKEYME